MPPVAVLALAVFGIASAPPLVVATWRLVLALGALGGVLVATRGWRQWRTLAARDHALAAAAGVMLALHFWSWNASLSYTTIAASVVLVNLQPVIVAAGSALLLREPPTRAQWLGMAAAIAGAILVAVPDFGAPARAVASPIAALPAAVVGDALAVVGALTASAYYLVGRRLRGALDLVPYVVLVYGWCLVTLVALCLARDEPLWPRPAADWWIFAGLAAGPMLLGHTGMNWALRHLPAHVVNLTVLGEPVGAALLAMAIPAIGERPGPWTLAGGAAILAGALLALGSPRPPRVSSPGS